MKRRWTRALVVLLLGFGCMAGVGLGSRGADFGHGGNSWASYGLFGEWVVVERTMQQSLNDESGSAIYTGYAIRSVEPGRDVALGLKMCLLSGLLFVGLDEGIRRIRAGR